MSQIEPSELSAAPLRAFFRIAEAWCLDDTQARRLMGDPDLGTWEAWRSDEARPLDCGVLERLSYLFSIYAALRALVGDHELMRAWLRVASGAPIFNGRSPLDHMLSTPPESIREVSEHLDSYLYGGW